MKQSDQKFLEENEAERGRIRENIELAFLAGKITAQEAADAKSAIENEWRKP